MRIQIFPLEFEKRKRIGIRPLGYDKAFPEMMKKIKGSRWTPNEKCWHIPYQKGAYSELRKIFGEGQKEVLSHSPAKAWPKKKTTLMNYRMNKNEPKNQE